MTRYLSIDEVLLLHAHIVEQTGGAGSIRDLGALQSAVAQPRMAFGGADLYATLAEKAAALGYSLIMNHPFEDGNKRIAHAAMEVFLMLNRHQLFAEIDDAEGVILNVAAGRTSRMELLEWVRSRISALE